jgi:hypothetical protein
MRQLRLFSSSRRLPVGALRAGLANPALRTLAALGAAGVAAFLAARYLNGMRRPAAPPAKPLDTWEGEGGNLPPRDTRRQLDAMHP